MRTFTIKTFILVITSAVMAALLPQIAIAANPIAPSNLSATFAPSENPNVGPSGTVNWISPNAGDAQILGYRISGRYLGQPQHYAVPAKWLPNGAWTEVSSRAALAQDPSLS